MLWFKLPERVSVNIYLPLLDEAEIQLNSSRSGVSATASHSKICVGARRKSCKNRTVFQISA